MVGQTRLNDIVVHILSGFFPFGMVLRTKSDCSTVHSYLSGASVIEAGCVYYAVRHGFPTLVLDLLNAKAGNIP